MSKALQLKCGIYPTVCSIKKMRATKDVEIVDGNVEKMPKLCVIHYYDFIRQIIVKVYKTSRGNGNHTKGSIFKIVRSNKLLASPSGKKSILKYYKRFFSFAHPFPLFLK